MKTLYLSIITVTVAVLVITWVMAQDRDTSMSFLSPALVLATALTSAD